MLGLIAHLGVAWPGGEEVIEERQLEKLRSAGRVARVAVHRDARLAVCR
jgi:hypothetical protein